MQAHINESYDPQFLLDCFVKIWATCEKFWGSDAYDKETVEK